MRRPALVSRPAEHPEAQPVGKSRGLPPPYKPPGCWLSPPPGSLCGPDAESRSPLIVTIKCLDEPGPPSRGSQPGAAPARGAAASSRATNPTDSPRATAARAHLEGDDSSGTCRREIRTARTGLSDLLDVKGGHVRYAGMQDRAARGRARLDAVDGYLFGEAASQVGVQKGFALSVVREEGPDPLPCPGGAA